MRYKLLIFVIAGWCVIFTEAISQHRVVLQSQGTATVFATASSFIDAYNAAADGDTIYLPGLEYAAPNPFNKRLVVYGTGHDPVVTSATGRTIITTGSSSIVFDPGASGSHLEGMYIAKPVAFRTSNKVDNVTFKRVHINGSISISGTNVDNRCNNILVTESIFQGLNAQNAPGIKVFNSFSTVGLQNLNENSCIANNIIVDYFYPVSYALQSHFENNIFVVNVSTTSFTGVYSSNGNTFNNNIFNRNPTSQENNTWSGNYTDVDLSGLFVDYLFPFSYVADYHLQNPGAYTGTTGNESGLFGGLNPYKENALPVTPHILEHTIATSADESGNLQINVSVQAQDK
ncbi:MAG: hypothetical protein R6W68_05290 [Ignavibacteriaceae bacterium]